MEKKQVCWYIILSVLCLKPEKKLRKFCRRNIFQARRLKIGMYEREKGVRSKIFAFSFSKMRALGDSTQLRGY